MSSVAETLWNVEFNQSKFIFIYLFFTAVLVESEIPKCLETVVSNDAEVMYLWQGSASIEF
jgi:hypothetical protein